MSSLYEDTALTPRGVARATGFLDWSSQPSSFKRYPDFLFRYAFGSVEELRLVELARMVSSATQIASKPYLKLTPPSAGNLHPVELYVQIRGVKGVLSGIYHVDAQRAEIVLVSEIQKDGLEPYVGLNETLFGMLFVISVVPFRAQWKYKERAIRYCYLDAGHQVGALACALKLYGQKMTILSGFDKKSLHDAMGFKDEEFVVAVAYSGELQEKSVSLLKQNLMYVAPTDYSDLDASLAKSLQKNELLKSQELRIRAEVSEQGIVKRRSARSFDMQESMSQENLEIFLEYMKDIEYPLSCYGVVLSDAGVKAGVYHKGNRVKEGSFAKEICSLLVDQKFIQNADIVYIVASKYFSANTLMHAALFTHELYMRAEAKGLGCSGIGAFYDKKLQEFLGIDEYVLYVSVVGTNKK